MTPRSIGRYALAVATVQILLYGIQWQRPDWDWLFYFDPRIGLFAFQETFFGGSTSPGVLSYLSALSLAGLGMAVLRDQRHLNMYLRGEALMAAPSVLFILVVIISNVDPSHGFSVGELLVPVSVFLVVSAVPYYAARRLVMQPPVDIDPARSAS